MPIKTIVALLLGLPLLAQAGEEKDQIATDRPDFVESSNVVGAGRFQIETASRWTATRPTASITTAIERLRLQGTQG